MELYVEASGQLRTAGTKRPREVRHPRSFSRRHHGRVTVPAKRMSKPYDVTAAKHGFGGNIKLGGGQCAMSEGQK